MARARGAVRTHCAKFRAHNAAFDSFCDPQFTWTVENFTKVKQLKLYSPVFQSGQYNWRILLFPNGNNVQQLSVYLDVADSVTLPQGWSRQAHFSLTVQNQKDPTKSVVKGAHGTHGTCRYTYGCAYTCACDGGRRSRPLPPRAHTARALVTTLR